jgi:hypothetical protein
MEITGFMADTIFRSLKTEQVLALNIEKMELGGLFVCKDTGLYALYHQKDDGKESTSTLSLCGLEETAEYADLIEESAGTIRGMYPTATQEEENEAGQ